MRRFSYILAAIIWLPLVVSSVPVPQAPPTEPIVLDIPPFVDSINFTNPQLYRSRSGVIFAATRDRSDFGGVVWRVDGYVSNKPGERGTPTQVTPTDPTLFFANGELAIYPDGYLYYISVQINNLQERRALAQFAIPIQGWTP